MEGADVGCIDGCRDGDVLGCPVGSTACAFNKKSNQNQKRKEIGVKNGVNKNLPFCVSIFALEKFFKNNWNTTSLSPSISGSWTGYRWAQHPDPRKKEQQRTEMHVFVPTPLLDVKKGNKSMTMDLQNP